MTKQDYITEYELVLIDGVLFLSEIIEIKG